MADPRALETELQTIGMLAQGDGLKAFQLVEHQLSVLVLRTQVLLSLCGIVITVTGFSGRAIAETSPSARALIASGITLVLASAGVAIAGVLRLQWLTQLGGKDWREVVLRGLRNRDRKSRYLAVALGLFLVGFSCYVAAIVQLLLAAHPH